MLLKIFYRSLDLFNNKVADNTFGCSFIEANFWKWLEIIWQTTKQNRSCHIRDIKVDVGATSRSYMIYEKRNKNKDRDELMEKIMTQMNLFTKHFMG